MSRTPLFAALKKALALASRDNSVVGPRTSALTRRTLLRSSAAAAGAAALSPLLDWSAYARGQPKGPIAIVGGGVAGLTAAYRLHQAGKTPIVFEASNRWGGRMFTRYDFYKGMFCELGAEFVDSNHYDLQKLLDEFGLEKQELVEEGETLYFFRGVFHTDKELLDPDTCSGAFVPIAQQIRDDHCRLKDERGNWTAHARDLDGISLKDYLESFRHKIKDDWVIDLLDVAYLGENGLETEDQSSLHLVDVIGTDLCNNFQIFGDSDECCRIKGGSSTLIDKGLVPALERNSIEMHKGFALTRIDHQNGQIVLSFDAPGGSKQRTFDAVILALPFTCLRNVEGLDSLGLSDGKLDCIRNLGMGHGAKIMVGTRSRVWRTPPASGLPVPSNGSALSDLAFHEVWQTSDSQPGKAGILTNFLGGNAGLNDAKSAFADFRAGLAKMSPKMAESLDPDPAAVIPWFWSKHRFTLGSYSCAKVGQYTTMFDEAWKPALDGRLQFAGEHTSGAKYQGYMNGAVRSGNRAACELLKLMALHDGVCPVDDL